MKIVYVSNSIIPSRTANSIHVMKICQAFAKLDNEVTLLAPDVDEIEPGIHDYYSYYDIENNFNIKKLFRPRIKGSLYLYGLCIASVVKKIKPDLVYGRFLIGCYINSIFLNVPVVFEAHQPIKKSEKIQEVIFKKIIKSSNFKKLVVISEALKQYYIEEFSIEPSKILVAHDGADIPSEEIFPPKLKGKKGITNIGYVGQLYSGKGMEVIAKIAPKCQWANFHIVGGLEKDIEYWKRELNDFDNVFFYGFVPHSQTVSYIESFDVVIAPYQKKVSGRGGKSNISQWMSPLKIFEYMALAKPIVASDLPVLREVLRNNENSVLCDPEDANEWVEALKRISNDKGKRNYIGLKAKEDFLSEYTWNQRAEKILSSLKE